MDNRGDDLMHEVHEQLQWERFEKIIKVYGVYIIGTVVAIILAVAIYVYLSHSQLSKQQALSQRYSDDLSLVATGQITQALENLKALSEDSSSYGMMANFTRAAILLEKPETKAQAVAVYREMIEGKHVDRRYRYLAIIFYCMAELDTGDGKELAKLMQEAAVGVNMWPDTTAELTALVDIKNGEIEQARAVLTKLQDNELASQQIRLRAKALLQTLTSSK